MKRAAILLLILAAFPLLAAEPLRNTDIVKMVKGGLTPDVIMLSIETSETAFDVSPDALIALAGAGVPQEVIRAMIARQSRGERPGVQVAPKAAPVIAGKSRKRFDVAIHRSKWRRCDKGELEITGSRIRATGCHELDFEIPWSDVKSICYDFGHRGSVVIRSANRQVRLSTITPIVAREIREVIDAYAPAPPKCTTAN